MLEHDTYMDMYLENNENIEFCYQNMVGLDSFYFKAKKAEKSYQFL